MSGNLTEKQSGNGSENINTGGKMKDYLSERRSRESEPYNEKKLSILEFSKLFRAFQGAITVEQETKQLGKVGKNVKISLPKNERFEGLDCQCFVYLKEVGKSKRPYVEISKSDMDKIRTYFKEDRLEIKIGTIVADEIAKKAGYLKTEKIEFFWGKKERENIERTHGKKFNYSNPSNNHSRLILLEV